MKIGSDDIYVEYFGSEIILTSETPTTYLCGNRNGRILETSFEMKGDWICLLCIIFAFEKEIVNLWSLILEINGHSQILNLECA